MTVKSKQQQQQAGAQHDRDFLPDQLDIDDQGRDQCRQPEDEQHIENVAANGIAQRQVRVAPEHGTNTDCHFWRARAKRHHGEPDHQR